MGDVHGDRGGTGAAGRGAACELPGDTVPAAEAGTGVPAATGWGAAGGRHTAAGGSDAVLPERDGDHARGMERAIRARGAGAERGAVVPGPVAVLGRDGGGPARTEPA